MGKDDSISTFIAMDPRIINPRAHELHTGASLFLDDAKALGSRQSAGQYVLYMHAVELALKGYLTSKGYSEQLLLKLGHDLDLILATARAKGLITSNERTDDVVARLNKYTDKARMRYNLQFFKTEWYAFGLDVTLV